MKKIIALTLAAVLVLGMAACGGKADTATEPKVETPASALEVLEKTWANYAEEDKFFAMGGFKLDEEEIPISTDGAPGLVEDADYQASTLLVPADQAANVAEAASLMHAMNANTFTGAAYQLTEGADQAAFVSAMQNAVQNNQWMCGFPEQLLIVTVGGIIVVAFGHTDAITPFRTNLTAVYAGAEVLVAEAIA